MNDFEISPIRNLKTINSPWEGNCQKKPWEYNVTAVIPCLDTPEFVEICVKLLRLQTEKPFIIVIDTGSKEEELEKICSLRAQDLEVHSLRLNGVLHPSDYPAMAMDAAFSLCRTTYLFATHADCFIRRRDFLEDLLNKTKEISPVVGYEMSPRAHSDWKGMVSHTATMYHMPTMDKIGFAWSLRKLANIYDIKNYKPNPLTPGFPDTEILGNYQLRYYKVEPLLIGSEDNFCRHKDDNIDHCRSITSGKLYSPPYYNKALGWIEEAKKEAFERIELWEKESETKEA